MSSRGKLTERPVGIPTLLADPIYSFSWVHHTFFLCQSSLQWTEIHIVTSNQDSNLIGLLLL